MHEYIRKISELCGLPEEARLYAEPVAERLDGTDALSQSWQAMLAHKDAGEPLRAFALENSIEPNRAQLAACLLLTRNMRAEYERKGISEQIYRDSLADIPIWAKCCKAETGKWGMKQFGWLSLTLRCELWRLGRLQFERVHFEADAYEKNGIALKRGDTVLNVHIPEGESLKKELREDAYERAVRFFGMRCFVCESWMLWPAHREMLSETSNIRGFMDDFTILHSWERPGVQDLWRIFGYLPEYSPEKLPRDTGLRRAYAERLEQNGGLTGGGYGVYIR